MSIDGRHEFYFWDETQVLDDQARAQARGSFIRLSQGRTHYLLQGPEEGRPVILLNGFSVALYCWAETVAPLAQAGRRVLCYDMFGRGFSDRPVVDYAPGLFIDQLKELVEGLGLAGPVDLAGFSMGATLAALFCAEYPELVRRVVLVSPGGLPGDPPLMMRMLAQEGLGERILDGFGEEILLAGIPIDFHRPERFEAEQKALFRPQMTIQGFRQALLSTIREGMLGDQSQAYQALGRQGRPVLLIWGEEDQVVPAQTPDRLAQAIPGLEIRRVARAGHAVHQERPKEVNPALVEFLTRPEGEA